VTESIDGSDALKMPDKENMTVIDRLDEVDMSENPELKPLKEAVQRARQRMEEATGIREALEAEAQEVAQLAVNAESHYKDILKQYEDAQTQLEQMVERNESLAKVVETIQQQLTDDTALSSQKEEDPLVYASQDDTSSSDLMEDVAEGDSVGTSLEDLLWQKTEVLSQAEKEKMDLEASIKEIELSLKSAEESYKKADDIAAAAMEAAEEAVRDEMDCITVANETESAMVKVLEDLKYFDDSSERREEEFDKKSKSAAAAAAAASGEEQATQSIDVDSAAQVAGAQAASKQATSAGKLESSKSSESDDGGMSSSRKQALVYLLTKSWQKHRLLLLAGSAAVAMTAILMSQEQFALAVSQFVSSIAAKLSQVWDVGAAIASKIPLPHVHESEAGILETIWLLLASVITVPLVCKLPGGSPVLGFLAGGALIGPYALGIIQDVESIRHLAELGVVFLLFNIGLELSFDRLKQMGKFVFGMGTAQVAITLAAVAYIASLILGPTLGGPAAVILGGGFALSTTAIGMQVLQDRGETGSRHGRAAFSVLLLQDLAVVVLLMLIPLLAPGPDGAAGAEGLIRIGKAIGFASIKAVVCMACIIVAGRTLLKPLYRRVADTNNSEIFAALTLLIVLGTSLITQVAGLSLALGAFLAGLLLAETEFHIQVESDIAPYKGLLMGLFFMTVGMEISTGLLFAKFKSVMAAITMLIVGKVAIMTAVGQAFGLSMVQAFRSGLLLSPGGEFAFVLYGEAVAKGLFNAALAKEMYLVVALSMALTPFLAEFGGKVGRLLEKNDMKALAPKDGELSGMQGHVIISGFGRVGQLIAQMLSEELIPFVALDTSAARVQEGKANDLPVYFGDAGSPAVLHSIGADNAACAVIALDTPGSNYRSVWAMHKHFPHVKTFCRAQDIEAGIMLEKAGATAVVPEVLEPSLQLGAAVLSELNIPEDEVAETIRSFRKNHLSELQMLAALSGSSLGYGQSKEKEEEQETTKEDTSQEEIVTTGDAMSA
jgi:monovalent cation:proton antiporter-2 (CPA2) family protein